MNSVAVLMSTYNGEKYIEEQVETILCQEGVNVTLFVRDDGSTDNTLNLVRRYEAYNIQVIEGQSIGVGNSFMQLVYDVPNSFDYYAFADQDDVWLAEKLFRATERIELCEGPTLYTSNQVLVDESLELLKMRYDTTPDISYKQIMCQNKVAGCTMVWNKELQQLLCEEHRRPSALLLETRIHDVWVAMVASVIGTILYDQESEILYRQHADNVVGVKKTNVVKQWSEKLRDSSQRNGRSRLCKEIVKAQGDRIIAEFIREDLELFTNYQSSLSQKKLLMNRKDLLKYSGESQTAFCIKVLLNLF